MAPLFCCRALSSSRCVGRRSLFFRTAAPGSFPTPSGGRYPASAAYYSTTGACNKTATTNIGTGGSVFWCKRIVFPDGIQEGSIVVDENGIIERIFPGQSLLQAAELVTRRRPSGRGSSSSSSNNNNNNNKKKTLVNLSLSSSLGRGSDTTCLSPGLIDVHVHISALGNRDWEGYASATKAASAGGITTVVGMPLNSMPATTTPASVQLERDAAKVDDLYADVALWGGVVPGNCNETDLNQLLESGVAGLKAFLSPLPPAAGFEAVSPEQLLQAAKICGKHHKPILVHSELMTEQELQQSTNDAFARLGSQSYEAHVQSRPSQWERDAVRAVCEAASFCDMHIVHLSDATGCRDMIRETKQNAQKRSLTVETCPHYLLFDSDAIQDGNTLMKCFPPIRDPANRERLWDGMRDGWIDMVASDHSPCEPSLRLTATGDLQQAWAGLSGLQYQLQATWTEAQRRGCSPLDMARWWSHRPSALARMSRTKGFLQVGKHADLCWWDTESLNGCSGREYHRWTGTTCYANDPSMKGQVLGTWVKGKQVYDGIQDRHLEPNGEFLLI